MEDQSFTRYHININSDKIEKNYEVWMIRAKIMTTSLTVHIKEIDPESELK